MDFKKYSFKYKKEQFKQTSMSFTVHVKLAAGFESFEEQFAWITSPILYFVWSPLITGLNSGVSKMKF